MSKEGFTRLYVQVTKWSWDTAEVIVSDSEPHAVHSLHGTPIRCNSVANMISLLTVRSAT
ncbi:hypothetical protein E2C01_072785 [Portunus trituberculatus]|uniref:Uncharacterized protein n=1 Tax=Portunus trituberculatus TaxID=210409 RepID=A0A5B7HYZ5_PORTR|nr:hypothetical protein [Portunus trituberculatus]